MKNGQDAVTLSCCKKFCSSFFGFLFGVFLSFQAAYSQPKHFSELLLESDIFQRTPNIEINRVSDDALIFFTDRLIERHPNLFLHTADALSDELIMNLGIHFQRSHPTGGQKLSIGTCILGLGVCVVGLGSGGTALLIGSFLTYASIGVGLSLPSYFDVVISDVSVEEPRALVIFQNVNEKYLSRLYLAFTARWLEVAAEQGLTDSSVFEHSSLPHAEWMERNSHSKHIQNAPEWFRFQKAWLSLPKNWVKGPR